MLLQSLQKKILLACRTGCWATAGLSNLSSVKLQIALFGRLALHCVVGGSIIIVVWAGSWRMGGVWCCERRHGDAEYGAPQTCCPRCCRSCCCLPCCIYLCPLFFCASEVHDSSSVASPSQTAGLLGRRSMAVSNPDICCHPPGPLPYDSDIRCSRPQFVSSKHEKNATNSLDEGDSALLHARTDDHVEGKSDVDDPKGKSQQPKIGKNGSVIPVIDDDDICPTCLEGYDKENPKIVTKCGHHFHLGCIYEWMERSNSCPVCDKEMVFSESL